MTWFAKDLFFDGVTGQDATKYGSLRDNYMKLIRDRIVGKFLRVEANRLLKDNPSLNGIEKSNFIWLICLLTGLLQTESSGSFEHPCKLINMYK